MPFTPFHMGPGILIKSLFHGGFSLMIFGWSQIIMDIQPLIVLITGEGHLHGFSHTYIGALLLASVSAISGRYLAPLGLYLLGVNKNYSMSISWKVAVYSALIGTFTHIILDSIMHADMQPFFPFDLDNNLLGVMSVEALHQLCIYTGVVGAALYYFSNWWNNRQ